MKKIFLSAIIIFMAFVSCEKERKLPEPEKIRDVSEVAEENDLALQEYLKTHFYNTATSTTGFDKVVGLDTIAGKNANKQSLWDNPNLGKKKFYIEDANGKEVVHTLYYLILKEGKGKQATVADISVLNYRGQLTNGRVVDENRDISMNSLWDLLGDNTKNKGGSIKGFRESVALLKASDKTSQTNSDGTFQDFTDYGKGVFFIPSRLAYFNVSKGSIPKYSPLIFTINLYQTENADHDKDGIPSIEEIKIDEEKGIVRFPDCNKNGIPDYLDPKNCN